MDRGTSTLTKAHSETFEPGLLCATKNNLSVLFRILAVGGPIAGTLGGEGLLMEEGGGAFS